VYCIEGGDQVELRLRLILVKIGNVLDDELDILEAISTRFVGTSPPSG
jgi:hypothetical protein